MSRIFGITTAVLVIACAVLLLAISLLYATGVFPVAYKDPVQAELEAERFCIREGALRIRLDGRTFVCEAGGTASQR